MKNIFIVYIFIASFTFAADAQMGFGVKAGMNTSSVGSFGDGNIRYHAGGFANYAVNPKFAVQGEILYSGQGYAIRAMEKDATNLNYINMPALAQCYVTPAFYIEFGPQIGFLTSAKQKGGRFEYSVKNQYNPIDFSVDLGMAYFFKKINLGINSRYTCSLSPVFKGDDINFHNRVFQIGAFYKIAGKK